MKGPADKHAASQKGLFQEAAGSPLQSSVQPALSGGRQFCLIAVGNLRVFVCVDRHSLDGIATCYGLDGPGIESLGGEIFAPFQTGSGAHPASYTMGTGSFPRVGRPKLGVDHPPPFSAEVKERVELHLYSSSGPSWPVIG
jgi:hypothetical protein